MPNQLLELGGTQLLELGSTREYWMGETPSPIPSTIRSIYEMVNTWDDPLAATGIVDDDLTPEALNVVNKIRAVNRRVRYSMGSSISLGAIDGYDDLMHLSCQLNDHIRLGSFFKRVGGFFKRSAKKHIDLAKRVSKKVVNVVKSPAFLGIAAIVVNVIPGIGQAASVALAAAATARKLYAQKIDKAKAKKAQEKFNKQQEAEFLQEVIKYNKKTQDYYEQGKYPVPPDQMLDKDGNPTSDPAKMPGVRYPININGRIYQDPNPKPPSPTPTVAPPLPTPETVADTPQPFPTQQQVVQAAALPAAMALTNGQGAWQANAVLHSFDAQTQREIAGEVSELQKFVNDPSFRPTSVKAIGQFVAMSEFDRGAGLGIMSDEQHALADAVKEHVTPEVQKAIEAGRQSLLTSAAMDGPDAVKSMQEALDAGQGSKFPWTYVFIGLGVAAAGGIGYALVRR